MQPQQIEGQRAQTILVVDSDESTRRILDLSLRHAGFAVRVASNAEEGGKRLADRSRSDHRRRRRSRGPRLLPPRQARRRDGARGGADARPDVESKRRGLEAGADDFVARPIYVQEVVARSRALLQRRDRERLEQSAHDNERFISTDRGRSARRSAARDRRESEVGRRDGHGRRRRARRDLLPAGARRRRARSAGCRDATPSTACSAGRRARSPSSGRASAARTPSRWRRTIS